ncbi:fimbrial protein [Buttiauxella sp. B2]|uniref:fimbrial protein n=1 Tax=Buttiauxella sp. B2 TaxID=2587812 RepID=UPI001120CCD8|nr:fimbrial protein [Buttiauxella sp. B2]TNV11213.1 fimbrial protein [Buttiauxella sp. B2]
MRTIVRLLITALVFLFASHAIAGCSYTYDQSYVTKVIDFGTVIVQRDTPAGTPLVTVNSGLIHPDYGTFYICSEAWLYQAKLGQFTTPTSLQGVYETNVQGVGIKVSTSTGKLPPYDVPVNGGTAVILREYTMTLVKTSVGAVGADYITPGAQMYIQANSVNILQVNIGTAKIIPVACSITTPSLVFTLGDIPLSQFGHNVGDTTPQTNTQNMGLNCDPGTNINVALMGEPDRDVPTGDVLALSGKGSAGVASGIGVQIVYNNTPLTVNAMLPLKTSAGGLETFPFTARYYQTQADVLPGDAKASATLQITYQ